MQLKSARAAWHEAYYSPEVSRTASAQEQAQLGTMVQKTSKANTTAVSVNHALAGLIQDAITMLPVPLQVFGHWMYAPLGAFKDYRREVWSMVALKAGITPSDTELWVLADAAIHSYRDLAQDKPLELSMRNRPLRVRHWLTEQHGIEIDSRRWCVKYAAAWDRLFSVMDELDRRALAPVSKVISDANEEPEDCVQWGKLVVNFKRAGMSDE